jgi:hypothetical protein
MTKALLTGRPCPLAGEGKGEVDLLPPAERQVTAVRLHQHGTLMLSL